jgi:isocitrate lyase
MSTKEQEIAKIQKDWDENPRWKGIKRGYTAADVVSPARLVPGRILAGQAAARKSCGIWSTTKGLHQLPSARSPPGQAMQQAKAGLEAVYLSGWQVAADGNTYETMYPDQSLYPTTRYRPW